MKKSIKSGIVAAVAVAAGFAAYQSYGSYGTQDSNLLMQNVEALAQDVLPEGPTSGDPGGGGSCPHNNSNHAPDRCLEAELITKEVTCHKNGGITLEHKGKGYSFSANFEKDVTYVIVAEIKNCSGICPGACCDQRKVGAKLKKFSK